MASAPSPQLLAGEARAFGHRFELGPDHRGVDFGLVGRLRREAAIGAGDDVLAPDQLGEAHQPFGDQLGMLDDIAGMRDHAGHDRRAVRQLGGFPDMVFVFVARIRGLEGEYARVHLEHVIDDVRQRRLVDARAFVDAVAGVEAHLLGRDAAQRVVDALDIEPGAALPGRIVVEEQRHADGGLFTNHLFHCIDNLVHHDNCSNELDLWFSSIDIASLS